MLSAILTWFLNVLLNWLLSKAKAEVEKAAEQIKKDTERSTIDEGNLKKYDEAKDRASRIEAATNLLNRTP